jgi:hypothetical protein
LHDDVAFAEFNRNFNFVSDDILLDFIARSKHHGNYSPYRMNFIRDEIVDKLMEQQKIFDIKYYLFNDIIVVVKSTIFKLKTININIYLV